jgi:hypothetical protein
MPRKKSSLQPWQRAKWLASPSSTREATPLTHKQALAAHEAGFEAARLLGLEDEEQRDRALMYVLKHDKRVPRGLNENHPDFWEWIEAILDGADDGIDSQR